MVLSAASYMPGNHLLKDIFNAMWPSGSRGGSRILGKGWWGPTWEGSAATTISVWEVYKIQIVVWHMWQHALAFTSCVSIFLILLLISTWTCGWTPSHHQHLHNHHPHMATSSCPQWGDHHVSGDLLHQWSSEHLQHNHTPSNDNRTGTKDHLHLLCHCLHHHRTRDTTTSTDQYCRYKWVLVICRTCSSVCLSLVRLVTMLYLHHHDPNF